VDTFHPPDAAPGTARLFAELHGRRADLPGLLSNAIVPKVKGHRIDRAGANGDGVLQVEFVAVMLAGDVGQDAEVGLLLQARGRITAGDVTAWDWGDFNYEGPKRRIAQWMADDARSLHEEMAAAAAELATQLAEKMREGPSSSATEKVRAWRAKSPR
jgi:hypothetical protein